MAGARGVVTETEREGSVQTGVQRKNWWILHLDL